MRKIISIILTLCIILSLFLTGCDNTGSGTNNGSGINNGVGSDGATGHARLHTVGVDKLPYSDEEIFAQLFDLNNLIEISIDISDEELLNIQRDYEEYHNKGSKSPIYREAALDISITTSDGTDTYRIPKVGVRMKGNTSRTSFYDEYEGQYNLIHYRVKFLEGDFATLECLELKWNKNDDSTYVREIYAYDMFRDMGVLAPHVNLASMDVADVHQGVFTMYEPVDKNFIQKYVAEEDRGGDLYKCGWTNVGASLTKECSIGIEDEENSRFYNYDLKTNKKDSNHEQMKNLIKVLNTPNVARVQMEKVVDMDNFLMFAAASYFVGNPDDFRNNYNNYYIYFLKSSGKAVFIPYDQDRVFGITKDFNPRGDAMASNSPYSTKAKGANNEFQRNPLFVYTTETDGYFFNEYTEALKQVGESEWMTLDKFNEYYRGAASRYSGYTLPDKIFRNAEHHSFTFDMNKSDGLGSGSGNASFSDYLETKMQVYRDYVK